MKLTVIIIPMLAGFVSCSSSKSASCISEQDNSWSQASVMMSSVACGTKNLSLNIATADLKPLPRNAAFVSSNGSAHISAKIVGDSLLIEASVDSCRSETVAYQMANSSLSATSHSKKMTKKRPYTLRFVVVLMFISILAYISTRWRK